MTAGGVLEARALSVGYPQRRGRAHTVLGGLELALQAGELTCLLGPNGSGKSTLLRTLAGMQPPLAGEALLQGTPVNRMSIMERARRLAVVLTDPIDVGLMHAVDLVALGRYPHTGWDGRLRPADRAAVDWALEATGAAPLSHRRVVELSDGERQRVAIARALAQQPAVLALDEPIAFIDVPRRVELTVLLRHLARECGFAVLLTTHDLDLAIRTADTVWLLEPGVPSRVHVGGPEDLVLAGAVGRAFRNDEVAFDLTRGTFVPTAAALGRARVVGGGVAARWTKQALEREGLAVVGAGERADLVVAVDGRGGGWRITSPVAGEAYDSVKDLLAAVRGMVPRLAGDSAGHHAGGPAADRAGTPIP